MAFRTNKPQPKYSSLRRKRRTKVLRTPDISGSKHIFLGVIALVFIVLLLFTLLKFITSGYFDIKDIKVIGVRGVKDSEINNQLDQYYGENILFKSSNEIESYLSDQFPTFKSVSVKKYWPNKLQLFVSETQPSLFYINFTGVYVVDEDAVVTQRLYSDKINLSAEQLNIITGEEGINSKLVEERLASEYNQTQKDTPEEEKIEFDINSVPIDQKFTMLNMIREELTEQSLLILVGYSEKFDKTNTPELTTVFVFENENYTIGESVDAKRVVLTSEVLRFLNQRSITVSRVLWEGKFLAKFVTDTNKQFVFATSRSISEQLEDFQVLTEQFNKENKNYTEIDFSSRKVSVK